MQWGCSEGCSGDAVRMGVAVGMQLGMQWAVWHQAAALALLCTLVPRAFLPRCRVGFSQQEGTGIPPA